MTQMQNEMEVKITLVNEQKLGQNFGLNKM